MIKILALIISFLTKKVTYSIMQNLFNFGGLKKDERVTLDLQQEVEG